MSTRLDPSPIDFEKLRHKFSSIHGLTIGDQTLDRNCSGQYEGYSREKESLPIFRVAHEVFGPGGAGNLAANYSTLGIGTSVAGVWGYPTDPHRRLLEMRFDELGIDATGMVEGASTPTFEKYYFPNGMHVIRVDVASGDLADSTRRQLIERVSHFLSIDLDFVAVADYDDTGKGVCSQQVLEAVASSALVQFGTSRQGIRSFVGFDTLMINEKELFESVGDRHPDPERKAVSLMSVTQSKKLAVTLGGRGIRLYQRSGKVIDLTRENPLNAADVPAFPLDGMIDTCGCGDTSFAMLSASLVAGYTFKESAVLANSAARAAARKLFGAHPVTLEEVEREYREVYS